MKLIFKSFLLLFILGTYSCVDQEFDVPPGFELQTEDLSNTTLAELKALHTVGNEAFLIPDGTVVKGIVISDDFEGNIYQTLFIQDETAGLPIRLSVTDLNVLYPPGRELFIDMGGLYLGDFNGLIQVGVQDESNNVERIPEAQMDSRFTLGQLKDQVVPEIRTFANLRTSDLGSLIQFNEVEFAASNLETSYANPDGTFATNKDLEDCSGESIVLRNSDFADFASTILPSGNGTLVAIYTIFGSTKQLVIRSTEDVQFSGDRCDGSGGGGGGGDVQETDISNISIAALKAMHTPGNNANAIADGTIIKGIITSDDRPGNFYQTLYMEDETAGIALRYGGNGISQTYPPGTRVYVDCSGLYLGDFNGLIQIGVQDTDNNVERIDEANIPNVLIRGPLEGEVDGTPITLDALSTDLVSKKVILSNVEFAQAELSNNYAEAGEGSSRNRVVTDCDGNEIIMRNSDFSDFAGTSLPNGNGRVEAVLSIFGSTYQLFIGDPSDVSMNGNRCDNSTGGGDPLVDLNFEDIADFDPINYTGWINQDLLNNTLWEKRSFDENGFAQIRGFMADAPMDTWLITPELNLTNASKMSFISATAFWTHNGFTVMYSTDFSGDIASAIWSELNPRIAGSSDPDYDWIPSGDVDLTGINGNGRIAFRYQGDPSSNTGTIRIDDLIIE